MAAFAAVLPHCAVEPTERAPPFAVRHESEHLQIGLAFEPGLCAGNMTLWEAQLGAVEQEFGVARASAWLFLYAEEQSPQLTADCESPSELGELAGCWDDPVARSTIPAVSHELVHAAMDAVNDDPVPFLREGVAVRMEGVALRGNYGRAQVRDDLQQLQTGPGAYGRAGHFVEWLVRTHGAERFVELYERLRRGAMGDEISQVFVAVLGSSLDDVVADYATSARDFYPGVGPFACGRGEPVVWQDGVASWSGEDSCEAESLFAVVGRPDRSVWGQRWRIEVPMDGDYLLDAGGHDATLTRCLTDPADTAELQSSTDPVADDWASEQVLDGLKRAQEPVAFAGAIPLQAGVYELWVRYIPGSTLLETSLDMSIRIVQ